MPPFSLSLVSQVYFFKCMKSWDYVEVLDTHVWAYTNIMNKKYIYIQVNSNLVIYIEGLDTRLNLGLLYTRKSTTTRSIFFIQTRRYITVLINLNTPHQEPSSFRTIPQLYLHNLQFRCVKISWIYKTLGNQVRVKIT